MAEKSMNAVLRLRRDSENNFKRSNIILLEGEVALVQTPFDGVLVKVGDGIHRFNELRYENFGVLVKGFMQDPSSRDGFVLDDNATIVTPENHSLFLDQNNSFLYYWDGDEYKYIGGNNVVLYDSVVGDNTDGAVTQRAVKAAFKQVQDAANNVVWKIADNDPEMLTTSFTDLQTLSVIPH